MAKRKSQYGAEFHTHASRATHLLARSVVILLGSLILISSGCGGSGIPDTPPLPAPSTPERVESSPPQNHFHEALRLGSAGRFEAAIREMELYLLNNPRDTVAIGWIAKWLSALGQQSKEAEVYRTLVEINKHDAASRLDLAKLQIRNLHECADGLKNAVIAKSLYSGRMQFMVDKLIGEAYECLGDTGKAIGSYRMYIAGAKRAGTGESQDSLLEHIRVLSERLLPQHPTRK